MRGVTPSDIISQLCTICTTGLLSLHIYSHLSHQHYLLGMAGLGATATIETDTVTGASPYVFNCSLRSVFGMNGMLADGKNATGFRSMVVAQFTAVSLQKMTVHLLV